MCCGGVSAKQVLSVDPKSSRLEIHEVDRLIDRDLVAVTSIRDADRHAGVQFVRADSGYQLVDKHTEIFGR